MNDDDKEPPLVDLEPGQWTSDGSEPQPYMSSEQIGNLIATVLGVGLFIWFMNSSYADALNAFFGRLFFGG